MAVITSSITVLNPQIQTRTPKSSEEGINSQLLDHFLKSCRGPTPTHLTPANTIPLHLITPTILNLPLSIIRKILRNLLASSTPIILCPDPIITKQSYHTQIEPNILKVCKVLYNIGLPILYGENILTTSSAATSFDFDEHLSSLSGSKRQMIRNVKLEIDWGDRLWAKFPLVARALWELKGLVGVEIVVVEGEEKNRTVTVGKDTSLKIQLTYGNNPPRGRNRTVHQCTPATDRADYRMKREGPLADTMLKAEKKMFKDLVSGIKGLKYFGLVGFRDQVFARSLEEYVRVGKHRTYPMNERF